MRVAPWLVASHADQVVEVLVSNSVAGFPARLAAVLPAGMTLIQVPTTDVWLQDQFEFGFHAVPGSGTNWNTVILNSPRASTSLTPYAEQTLLTGGTGLYGSTLAQDPSNWQSPPANDFDSFGDLECLPPIPSNSWTSGQVYRGQGMTTGLQTLLYQQDVQNEVSGRMNTAWLTVGHVDEFMSIQMTSGGAFRAILASPSMGITALQNAPSYIFNSGQLWGPTVVQTSGQLLTAFQTFNVGLQAIIDQHEQQLVSMGVTSIVKIPAFFYAPNDMENGTPGAQAGAPPTGDRALAALPGMVNMLNVNGTLIIPEPFFPEFTNGVLNSLGSVTIGWIDCREYHHNQGEVHCGTNVRRQPSIQAQAWWNIEP